MQPEARRVAVTGAGGFIGRNLVVRLRELGLATSAITRDTPAPEAGAALAAADVVVHLAGAVRPHDALEFTRTQAYAAWVVDTLDAGGRRPLLICSSSVRADCQM